MCTYTLRNWIETGLAWDGVAQERALVWVSSPGFEPQCPYQSKILTLLGCLGINWDDEREHLVSGPWQVQESFGGSLLPGLSVVHGKLKTRHCLPHSNISWMLCLAAPYKLNVGWFEIDVGADYQWYYCFLSSAETWKSVESWVFVSWGWTHMYAHHTYTHHLHVRTIPHTHINTHTTRIML